MPRRTNTEIGRRSARGGWGRKKPILASAIWRLIAPYPKGFHEWGRDRYGRCGWGIEHSGLMSLGHGGEPTRDRPGVPARSVGYRATVVGSAGTAEN
jgi:hypothetical protein